MTTEVTRRGTRYAAMKRERRIRTFMATLALMLVAVLSLGANVAANATEAGKPGGGTLQPVWCHETGSGWKVQLGAKPSGGRHEAFPLMGDYGQGTTSDGQTLAHDRSEKLDAACGEQAPEPEPLKDGSASVSVTPATCDAPATLVYGNIVNATFSGTPNGTTGPGSYDVTATATSGHKMTDGESSWNFTGDLAGKLPRQSSDPYAPCYDKPFDWNWQYPAPTCDGLTVTYPNGIPAGSDHKDVNIRVKNLTTGEVRTFNFHDSNFTTTGKTVTYKVTEHPDWPGWTYYEYQWTQVHGTNYHWEGSVTCGTPPTEDKLDASASVSVTPATCDAPATLVYGNIVNATFSGTPNGTTGPGSYDVTATATSGHKMTDGESSWNFTGDLPGAIPAQSTDPEGDCYKEPETEPETDLDVTYAVTCVGGKPVATVTIKVADFPEGGDEQVLGVYIGDDLEPLEPGNPTRTVTGDGTFTFTGNVPVGSTYYMVGFAGGVAYEGTIVAEKCDSPEPELVPPTFKGLTLDAGCVEPNGTPSVVAVVTLDIPENVEEFTVSVTGPGGEALDLVGFEGGTYTFVGSASVGSQTYTALLNGEVQDSETVKVPSCATTPEPEPEPEPQPEPEKPLKPVKPIKPVVTTPGDNTDLPSANTSSEDVTATQAADTTGVTPLSAGLMLLSIMAMLGLVTWAAIAAIGRRRHVS